MDHVDQHRPATGLAPPWCGIEVVIGLVEQRTAHYRHQVAEQAFGDHLAGFVENGAVCPMVADQQLCPALLGNGQQALALCQAMGHRFFDQCGDALLNTGQRAFHMQGIGGGKNDPVRALLSEQLLQRGIQRHSGGCGKRCCSRSRINQRAQLARGVGLDQFDVTTADQAGTGDGDA
ncbi:hypothetical protein D3C72_1362510 [compost metagenome]